MALRIKIFFFGIVACKTLGIPDYFAIGAHSELVGSRTGTGRKQNWHWVEALTIFTVVSKT